MRKSAVFIAMPLVVVPVITAVMLVGGKVEQPGGPASDPTVGRHDVCTEDGGCSLRHRLGRPLEC